MDTAGLFHLQGLFWALGGLMESSRGQGSSSRRKLCGQSRHSLCLLLGHILLVPTHRERNGEVESPIRASIPFSIFTATVRQVGDFLMPNADACTTFPKAPLPSDLPTMERRRWFVCQVSRISLSFLQEERAFSLCVYLWHVALKGISNEWTPNELGTHLWGIFLPTLYCASMWPLPCTVRLGPSRTLGAAVWPVFFYKVLLQGERLPNLQLVFFPLSDNITTTKIPLCLN